MSITDHTFEDEDIKGLKHVSDGVLWLSIKDDPGYIEIYKQDAVALAKHFGLIK